MDNTKLNFLKQLLDTFGPSGNEEHIRELIQKEIKDYVDEIKIDSLGNLIAHKKGIGKKIMLAAHMDEIGLIITHIDKNGFLRFSNIGGVSASISLGQKISLKDGTIGVVSSEHLEEIKELKLDKLYIDIGANSREEAEKKVSIGSVVSFYGPLSVNDNRAISKAMDDRIGCFVLVEIIKNMKDNSKDLYFVFTVQEELGIRGAKTSAYGIDPDLGIAVDVTSTGDTPKCKSMEVSLGKGPTVKIMDGSVMCHPRVKELLISTAKKYNIPYQLEVLEYGGTDAGAIHLTREGIPSGAVSIPTRYIHSPGEMVDLKDVEYAIELLAKSLQEEI
jgi:endoglucanase